MHFTFPKALPSLRRSLSIVLTWLLLLLGSVRAADLDRPPPGAFTIVVVPDTQGYRGARTKATPDSTAPLTNPVLANHIKWIRENIAEQHIVFVSHVGDIVDIDNDEQWQLAKEILDPLFGVVPFGLVVGNHDMKASGDATLFQKYFPAERFKKYPWYGGSFESREPGQAWFGNNVNSYQLFSAGGLDFVILHLECNAPDEVLAWAGEVLTRHQDRRALITTHMDLGVLDHPKTEDGFINDPKGRMRWSKIHGARGNTAVQMWEKLYRKHANLGFVFSGDQSRVTALRLAAQGDHGNTVHSLLSDYMSVGPLRLYRFLPDQNKVRVITYDTTKRELVDSTIYVPDRDQHQFELDYNLPPPPPAGSSGYRSSTLPSRPRSTPRKTATRSSLPRAPAPSRSSSPAACANQSTRRAREIPHPITSCRVRLPAAAARRPLRGAGP